MMNFFNKKYVGQNVLTLLFVIYLVLGYNTPLPIASLIDTDFGKIVVILIAILLFVYANPILGVIGFFVAFDLIRRSTIATGSYGVDHYLPNEQSKKDEITRLNYFPYTLEQEMVKKMVPLNNSDALINKATYVPSLDDTYGASTV
jgi:hypothetical protein